jgi:trans-2,3-dihydro-3-hydroxyanthranilate isomerase
MTSANRIYLLDVFAEQAYCGNPLAVITTAEPLPGATMQRIAAKMNFSETTFVATSADADGGYATRVFTPVREIAFTGHPIIGTAWVVRRFLLESNPEQVFLNLGLGQITVDFEPGSSSKELCWFSAPTMTLGEEIEPQAIARALGLVLEDIDTRTPVQVISAETGAIMVPLRNLDALNRARLNLDTFGELARRGHPPLTYLFCNETGRDNNDYSVRFFFEAGEVREDPATGNGAAFFGAYLRHHLDLGSGESQLRIEQGEQVQRPSLIHLQINPQRVRVGGCVVATVSGELLDDG